MKVVFAASSDGILKRSVEAKFPGGFAVSQKQKAVEMLHDIYQYSFKGSRPLEISTKSKSDLGKSLSAFNLRDERGRTVETLFQSSKVFENGGPYKDLLEKTSKEAKIDERLRTSGKLVAFEFEGGRYALEPKTAFYNWIYIDTLCRNQELVKELLDYVKDIEEPAFTDIEFNPDRSLNCQAEAIALFIYLIRKQPLRKEPVGLNFYEVSTECRTLGL